jgi:hypothetical protein
VDAFRHWFHEARAPWLPEAHMQCVLDARNVCIRASLGAAANVTARVCVGRFASACLPHTWQFDRVRVDFMGEVSLTLPHYRMMFVSLRGAARDCLSLRRY